jgi:hypothetical protein
MDITDHPYANCFSIGAFIATTFNVAGAIFLFLHTRQVAADRSPPADPPFPNAPEQSSWTLSSFSRRSP